MLTETARVFLVGPMGSGKTAVGKVLARRLGWSFLDSDAEIVRRTGVEIPVIFEMEGEPGFRLREAETLEALSQCEHVVVSTGGGAVTTASVRELLRARGIVVYLETSVAQQAARVRGGRNRPMLAGTDPATRLAELMQVREPLYLGIADLTVRTDDRRVEAVAQDIEVALRRLQRDAAAPSDAAVSS